VDWRTLTFWQAQTARKRRKLGEHQHLDTVAIFAAEPLPSTLLATMRQEAGDAVARQDAERVQAIARRRFRPRRQRRLNSERLGRKD
jgi:hypothetical protein